MRKSKKEAETSSGDSIFKVHVGSPLPFNSKQILNQSAIKEHFLVFVSKFWEDVRTFEKKLVLTQNYINTLKAFETKHQVAGDLRSFSEMKLTDFFKRLCEPGETFLNLVGDSESDPGTQLDWDMSFLRSKFAEQLEGVLSECYEHFFKSDPGPRDSEFCDKVIKILKINWFLEGVSESTIAKKLQLNLAHFFRVALEPESHKDSLKEIVHLFMQQSHSDVNFDFISSSLNKGGQTKEGCIAEMKKILERKTSQGPGKYQINLELVFRSKLLQCEQEIKFEVGRAVEKCVMESLESEKTQRKLAKIEEELKLVHANFLQIKSSFYGLTGSSFDDLGFSRTRMLKESSGLVSHHKQDFIGGGMSSTDDGFVHLILEQNEGSPSGLNGEYKLNNVAEITSNQLTQLPVVDDMENSKGFERSTIGFFKGDSRKRDQNEGRAILNGIINSTLTLEDLKAMEISHSSFELMAKVEEIVCVIADLYVKLMNVCARVQSVKTRKDKLSERVANHSIHAALTCLDRTFKKKGSPLLEIISETFEELRTTLEKQKETQMELKSKQREDLLDKVGKMAKRKERKSFVDVSITDLSYLLRIAISELKLDNLQSSQPVKKFLYYNVQDAVQTHLNLAKSSKRYDILPNYILFFYKFTQSQTKEPSESSVLSWEGFKLILGRISQAKNEISLKQFVGAREFNDADEVMNFAESFKLEYAEKGKFSLTEESDEATLIQFDEALIDYDLTTLLCLTLYQVFFKNLSGSENQSNSLNELVSPIMISKEHLEEFEYFLAKQRFRGRDGHVVNASTSSRLAVLRGTNMENQRERGVESNGQERILKLIQNQKDEARKSGGYSAQEPRTFKFLNSMYDMGRSLRPGMTIKSAVNERPRNSEEKTGKDEAKRERITARGTGMGAGDARKRPVTNRGAARGADAFYSLVNKVRSELESGYKKKVSVAVNLFANEIQKTREKLAKRGNAVSVFVKEFEGVQMRLANQEKEKHQKKTQKGANAAKVFYEEVLKFQSALERKRGKSSKQAVDVFEREVIKIKSHLENKKQIETKEKAEKEKAGLQKQMNSGKQAAAVFEKEFSKMKKGLEDKAKEEVKMKEESKKAELKSQLEKEKADAEKKKRIASEASSAFEKEFGKIKKELEEKTKKEKAEKEENQKKMARKLAAMGNAAKTMEEEITKVRKTLENEKKKQIEAEKLEKEEQQKRDANEKKKKEEKNAKSGKAAAAEFEQMLMSIKEKLGKIIRNGENAANVFIFELESTRKAQEKRKKEEEEQIKKKEAAALEAKRKAEEDARRLKDEENARRIEEEKAKKGKEDEDEYEPEFDEEDIPEEEFEEIGDSIGDSPPKSSSKKQLAKEKEPEAPAEPEGGKRTKSRLLDAVRNFRNVEEPEPANEKKKPEKEAFDKQIEDSWGADPFDSSQEPKSKQVPPQKPAEEQKPSGAAALGAKKNEPAELRNKDSKTPSDSENMTPSRNDLPSLLIREKEIQKINVMFNQMELLARFSYIDELFNYENIMHVLQFLLQEGKFIWDVKLGSEIVNSEFKQFSFAKEKGKNNDMMSSCKVVADELLSFFVKMTETDEIGPDMSIILPFDPASNKFKIFGMEISILKKYVWLFTNDSYPLNLKGKELTELNSFVSFNWNIGMLLCDQKVSYFQETSAVQGFSLDFIVIPEKERPNYANINFYALNYHIISALHYDREYSVGEESIKDFVKYVNENCLEQVDFRRHHANFMACLEVETHKEEILQMISSYVEQFRQEGEIIENIEIEDPDDLNSYKGEMVEQLKEVCENYEKTGEALVAISITENISYYITLEAELNEEGELVRKLAVVIDPFFSEGFVHKKDCMDLIIGTLQAYDYEVNYVRETPRHSLVGTPVAVLGFVKILQKQFHEISNLDLFSLVLYSMGAFFSLGDDDDEEEEEGEGNLEGEQDEDEIGMIIGDDDEEEEEVGNSNRQATNAKNQKMRFDGGPAVDEDEESKKQDEDDPIEDFDDDYGNVDFDDEDVAETIEALEKGGSSGKLGAQNRLQAGNNQSSPTKNSVNGASMGDEYGEDFEEEPIDDDDDYAF